MLPHCRFESIHPYQYILLNTHFITGFAVPKESVDTIKARELELAKNMEKFKKAKAEFAKLKG